MAPYKFITYLLTHLLTMCKKLFKSFKIKFGTFFSETHCINNGKATITKT